MAIWEEEISFPKWKSMRFEVFLGFLDRSSSNQEWDFGGRISSSSNEPSLGEDSTAESRGMEGEGLGSATGKSSWVDSHSSRRASDSASKEVYSIK